MPTVSLNYTFNIGLILEDIIYIIVLVHYIIISNIIYVKVNDNF